MIPASSLLWTGCADSHAGSGLGWKGVPSAVHNSLFHLLTLGRQRYCIDYRLFSQPHDGTISILILLTDRRGCLNDTQWVDPSPKSIALVLNLFSRA